MKKTEQKAAQVKPLTAAEVKAAVATMPPHKAALFALCISGARVGPEEFPELWPGLIAATEDDKTEVRLHLGFPK